MTQKPQANPFSVKVRKFRCAKCGGDVPVQEDLLQAGSDSTVTCPGCGARYRRRTKEADQTARPSTGSSSVDLTRLPTQGSGSSLPSAVTADSSVGQTSPPQASPATAVQPSQQMDSAPTVALPTAPRPTFAPGELIGERYRIQRFIAKGGMGEVYEALDLVLNERTAIKTIRPQVRAKKSALNRFMREIQLARRVTHPNVCRLFDLGHHAGQSEGVTFLSMEYLEGPTLARQLKSHGPMSTDEAEDLVVQVAAGLGAAHRAGVVHRDFKSDNVMLVPTLDGVRAVITDFGVAFGTLDQPDASGARDIVGTPAYMAPEQVAGGPITGAVDIYALGIVMYEMVTGKVPFVGGSALETARMRLSDKPKPPCEHKADLDHHWQATILRCLEREPEDRFGNTEELVDYLTRKGEKEAELRAQLEREKQEAINAARRQAARRVAQARTAQSKSQKGQKIRLTLAIALLLASLFLVYQRVSQSLSEPESLAELLSRPIEARRAVAVLGFRNVSERPEADWLATAMAEMLGTELGRTGQLRIIPPERVTEMRIELALTQLEQLTGATLQRIARMTGTDYVLSGSYVSLPQGQLRLDFRLVDAATNATVAVGAQNGTEAQLFELIAKTGQELRSHLKLDKGPLDQIVTLPLNREAARLYSDGLEHLRAFEPLRASELLEESAKLEPRNALIHSARAAALATLGYTEKSRQAAQLAYDLSDQLPEEEKLRVEGQYREAAQQWQRAAQIYETLWRAYPDNLEYGLRLSSTLISDGRGNEAFAILELLRKLPEPSSNDPRIDLAEATAAVSLSLFQRQQSAAARAAAAAEDRGLLLVSAQARVMEAEALRQLGRSKEATEACEAALDVYVETGHRAGEALARTELANILFAGGSYEEAQAGYEEALRLYTETGDQGGVLRALNNLAVVQRNRGRLAAAGERYEEILEVSRRVGSKVAEASVLNNLGAVRFQEGNLEAARHSFQQAIEVSSELGLRNSEATSEANLAVALRNMGDFVQARSLQLHALESRRDIGNIAGEAASLAQLGHLAVDKGDLEAAATAYGDSLALAEQAASHMQIADAERGLARLSALRNQFEEAIQHLDKAEALRREIGERAALQDVLLQRVRLLVQSGQLEEAQPLATQLAIDLQARRDQPRAAQAYALLAQIYRQVGNTLRAREALDEARKLSGSSGHRLAAMRVEVEAGRLLIAEGQCREAQVTLESVLESALKIGWAELKFESRIALADCDLRQGGAAAASSTLSDIVRQAREQGFLIYAEQAEELSAR